MVYPSSQFTINYKLFLLLSLANPEHLGTAFRAGTLSGWFAILHFDCFGIAHFPLGATFHAVCLHRSPPIV
jgi:hypothetical protein